MTPWNKLENSYFWLAYSYKTKHITLRFLWKHTIIKWSFKFSQQKYKLSNDEQYHNEVEAYHIQD